MNTHVGNTLNYGAGSTLWVPTTRQTAVGAATLGTHTEVLAPKVTDAPSMALSAPSASPSAENRMNTTSGAPTPNTLGKEGKEGIEQLGAFAGGISLAFGLDRMINRWMQHGDAHSPMLKTAHFLDNLPGIKQLNQGFDTLLHPLLKRTPFLQALGGYLPPHSQMQMPHAAGELTYHQLVLGREVEAYQKALDTQLDALWKKQAVGTLGDVQFAQKAKQAWTETLQQHLQQHQAQVAKGEVLPSLTQLSDSLSQLKHTPLQTLSHDKALSKHMSELLHRQSLDTAENLSETSKALTQKVKTLVGNLNGKMPLPDIDLPPIRGGNTHALWQAFEKKLSPESLTLWQSIRKANPDMSGFERLKQFNKHLQTREQLLAPLAKRTSSLFMRLKGMDGFVLQPYEMAYQLKHHLMEQHNQLARVLEASSLKTSNQEKVLRLLGQRVVTGLPKEALTKLVDSVPELNSNTALRQQVLAVLEKEALRKPLGAVGRTIVASTTMLSRIVKGETAVASSNAPRNLLKDGTFSLKKTLAPGMPMGLGLTGLALLGLPFSEAIKAEGDMTEKMKVFIRYFAGFSLGSFVGWELGKRLIHGSQILLRTMPGLMTRKLPGMTMATLVGEMLASIVIGGKVQQIIEGVCDAVIGKPKTILKKELEEKAKEATSKAKYEAEKAKIRSIASQSSPLTSTGANPTLSSTPVTSPLNGGVPSGASFTPVSMPSTQLANPQLPVKLPSASLYGQGDEGSPKPPSLLPEKLPATNSPMAQAGITPNSPLHDILTPPMPETQNQLETIKPLLNPIETSTQPTPSGLHSTPEKKPLSTITPEDILKGHVPEPGIEAVSKGPSNLVDELRPE
ncbi:MAG: hypothetical protein ACKO37_05250 [Vampirovibrionales bacterium]